MPLSGVPFSRRRELGELPSPSPLAAVAARLRRGFRLFVLVVLRVHLRLLRVEILGVRTPVRCRSAAFCRVVGGLMGLRLPRPLPLLWLRQEFCLFVVLVPRVHLRLLLAGIRVVPSSVRGLSAALCMAVVLPVVSQCWLLLRLPLS